MFIHNSLLKHPLEMAAVTDTNTALQSPLGLSIREAALNICGEKGEKVPRGSPRPHSLSSLSIPRGSAFGPEDSRYY